MPTRPRVELGLQLYGLDTIKVTIRVACVHAFIACVHAICSAPEFECARGTACKRVCLQACPRLAPKAAG